MTTRDFLFLMVLFPLAIIVGLIAFMGLQERSRRRCSPVTAASIGGAGRGEQIRNAEPVLNWRRHLATSFARTIFRVANASYAYGWGLVE